MNILMQHAFPGNVRELDNLIQRVAVLAGDDLVQSEDIVFEMHLGQSAQSGLVSLTEVNSDQADNQLGNDMRNHEYQLIVESLAKCNGKKKAVAEQLGISARTLRYKIAKMREAGYAIPDKKSFA